MNAIFEALCRASIFGLVALAVALLAQWLLNKRVPASWRAWIWRIALLQSAFALLPIAPIRWEILAPPNVAPIAATSPDTTEPDEFFVPENLPPLSIPDAAPIESAPPIPVDKAQPALSVSIAKTPFDWRALMLAIYSLGIIFQFKQLARGYRQLQRTLRACTPAKNSDLIARLNRLSARLNLKSAPQILISEGKSPFLTGVWRPQIVLPRALCDVETAQLDAILAHELAHQKRRDLIWLGATWLLQTLLWFHPLAWAARRFHGLEIECACDELALQLAPIAPQSYGALLLNSMNNSKFSSPLAAGTCDTLFALKTRLLRLNSAPKKPRRLAKLAFAAALALSCGAVVPMKLVARAGEEPIISEVIDRAVVQGVVTSEQTGKPLAGVTVILISDRITQQFVTDARGYFRFNAPKGNYFLGANQISPTRAFYLKNGQKRDFKLELDETFKSTGKAVVQGVVLAPQSRKPLAGTLVVSVSGKELQQSLTDARGSFRFNVQSGKQMVSITKMETNSGGRIQANTIFDVKDGKTRKVNFDWDEIFKQTDTNAPTPKVMGSAVVQGVVTSRQTGQPLAGVNVTLTAMRPGSKTSGKLNLDSSTKQEILTDNRGYFRFNATSGKHLIAVGFMATTASRFPRFNMQIFAIIDLKSGKKHDLGFDIDDKSKRDPNRIPTKLPATRGTGDAVVQGVIVSKQTQKPLAGVPIIVVAGNAKMMPKQQALAEISTPQKTVTDARGYFRFNVAGGVHSLLIDGRISLNAGKISGFSAQQILVLPLKDGTMRNFGIELDEARSDAATALVAATNAASASGQIVDENKRPLTGVTVSIYQNSPKASTSIKSVKSDKDGRFVLQGLNPNTRMSIHSSLSGYGPLTYRLTKDGENKVYEMSMPRASATLRGVVIGEDGQPARNFLVKPSAHALTVKTDAQGRFFLSQVVPGATDIRVSTPNGGNGWGPIKVRGGDQNVKVRLTHSISDARFPVIASGPATSKKSSDKTRALIGKIAPEIRKNIRIKEKTSTLKSLRGQVVLLALQDFNFYNEDALTSFARSFTVTARVVGVQFDAGGIASLKQTSFDAIVRQFPFPIALDETIGDGNPAGGATFSDYGFVKTGGYVVIGRDGKIIYAGDELNRAIQFASR